MIGKSYFVICICLFAVSGIQAKVVPNSLFGNHAVLQQGVTVPVWGTADMDDHIQYSKQ
jgi:sialate O-acetylesterase